MNTKHIALLTALTTSFGISSSYAEQSFSKKMEANFAHLQKLMHEMQRDIAQVDATGAHIWQEPTLSSSKHNHEEEIKFEEVPSSPASNLYQLILHLPGFNKNPKVSLKNNILSVEATKDFKGKEKTAEGRVVNREESYSSTTSFKGSKQTITYKNGALKATFVLPKTINAQTKYECVLQDEKLVMKFFLHAESPKAAQSLVVKKK